MTPWPGLRSITVVSACMNANGCPDFAVTEVEVTHDEYENGVHYDLADAQLAEAGYEEPIVHFDSFEAPAFLLPAVRRYLRLSASPTHGNRHAHKEKSRCRGS
jgi:hypothetical protein